ncbi:hypothetical protein [Burkholderia vietnamiensis]|uniref:hypothetical protein n=1 Tax=Burkholderia vietnamiensis TaxID=60552 RepID=UPI001B8EB2EA|nr:hypothetical protein [Burkholderia vietnamiensis]MBR8218576.1 hypothetical protein [Burkholderia vietnamiensis]MCA8181161.1 hypothetical protein [Burkholderia vietnamiensis]
MRGHQLHFAEPQSFVYVESSAVSRRSRKKGIFTMSAPTIDSLSAAARAGITVIQRDGNTMQIRGATASIGTSVVDVFFDPELGAYVWTVDGIERSVDWVRWFLETE